MKNEQARPQHSFLRLQAVQKFYDRDPLFNFHPIDKQWFKSK